MKRLITVIGILLTLLAGPSWAVEPINLALASAILGGAGAGVAAASCSVSTDFVGTKNTASGNAATQAKDMAQCFLATASCSGTLATAYAMHANADTANGKMCLYSYDSDAPDAGDEKIGCSGNMASTDIEWVSAAMDGGTVVSGTSYFICFFVSADSESTWTSDQSDEGSINLYYKASSGYYATPPANLGTGWSSASLARRSWYITIGP